MKSKILIIPLVLLFISCGIGPKNLNGFSVYKYPIKDKNINFIKLQGAYIKTGEVSKGATIRDAIKFNKDGHCFITIVDKGFWENKHFWKDYDLYFPSDPIEYSYNFDSEYKIVNDIITIQYFVSRGDAFYSKYIIEEKYKTLNDSTLYRYEWTTYKGDLFDKEKDINYVSDTLIFFHESSVNFKTKRKWYENKKWYIENLHNSRKNQ
ncbi:hypothetical protein MNBD_BACTEROID02-1112 [hydrothermal vent metagenome]|uniref:Lipoprotein n=1 Tax=hydrothermal vent metagenome TaxID=652676 RepID=A0A3B0RAC3_9ZZZZ